MEQYIIKNDTYSMLYYSDDKGVLHSNGNYWWLKGTSVKGEKYTGKNMVRVFLPAPSGNQAGNMFFSNLSPNDLILKGGSSNPSVTDALKRGNLNYTGCTKCSNYSTEDASTECHDLLGNPDIMEDCKSQFQNDMDGYNKCLQSSIAICIEEKMKTKGKATPTEGNAFPVWGYIAIGTGLLALVGGIWWYETKYNK